MRCNSPRNQLIPSTDNISLHPVRPIRGRSPRSGSFSAGSLARSCRTYFDWHPIIGGFAVLITCAVIVTALLIFFEAFIPSVGGWPLLTPVNGVVLAVLLKSRRKLWPFLLVGYVLALLSGTAWVGMTRHPAPLEVLGNLIEITLAAFTLPPYRNLKQWLQEPRLLRSFTAYALLLGPTIMASIVAFRSARTASVLADFHANFWQRTRIVGLAEALGVALGVAVVLVLSNRQTYRLFRWRNLPATLGLSSLLGLATWFALNQTVYPAIFLTYAFLVATAFLLGIRGAVLGTAIVCGVLIARSPHAPLFAGQALSVQSYIALAVITVFPLSVALFNRSELEVRVKEYQSELDKLKSLDRLTGVSNRKRFDLVLTREWQRATRDPKPIALLMIDTDFFDLYNEHYGTHAGDECLRRIAAKLAAQPHRQYDLVSRFEGGRFSVLLPGAAGPAVKRIAEDLRAEIAALEWPHERSQFGRVTVSVGWASMLPETNLHPALLISAAEAALSTAKKNGKNRVEGFGNKVVEMSTVTH